MPSMNFVTHLECANCGKQYDATKVQNLCTVCQRPLWVRYDLDALKKNFTKKALFGRPPTIWRYLEMLPIRHPDKIVSLTETITPILETRRLAARFGVKHLFLKDESRLPTGSFKARGMALAVSMANEFGLQKLAVPTAGNAGGALAAYAARAGIEAYVFMPDDTPAINRKECYLAGAKTYLVNGLITDCGRIVAEGKATKGWFDVSTLKEPYRIEGKKTMGLELAEQFDWELPDVILYPTGGGTGLIGMWKAFNELERLGWLKSPRKPKMIACQSEGCAPIATDDNCERHSRPCRRWRFYDPGCCPRERWRGHGIAGSGHSQMDVSGVISRRRCPLSRNGSLLWRPRNPAGARNHQKGGAYSRFQYRCGSEISRSRPRSIAAPRYQKAHRLADHSMIESGGSKALPRLFDRATSYRRSFASARGHDLWNWSKRRSL